MSISSGALVCMRKAISNALMRVAISGSPTASSRVPIELRRARRANRAAAAVDAAAVGQIQHRLAAGAERHALVHGGQKAAAPVRVAAAGPLLAGAEHDEAGQVLRFAPQAVRVQAPKLGRPNCWLAGVHQDLAGRVVERVGDHRRDDRDVVDHFGQVRQQFRQLGPALAVPGELELAARAASSWD